MSSWQKGSFINVCYYHYYYYYVTVLLWTETRRWSIVHTDGKGPCARRRQCCCVVGSKVYLFGGTSPNPNPPSPIPLAHRMERASDLIDHADLHVLDFSQFLHVLVVCSVWWVGGFADGWSAGWFLFLIFSCLYCHMFLHVVEWMNVILLDIVDCIFCRCGNE